MNPIGNSWSIIKRSLNNEGVTDNHLSMFNISDKKSKICIKILLKTCERLIKSKDL